MMALALAAPIAAGCGAPDDGASPASLEERLHADTGVEWRVDRDEAGAAKFVTAVTAPPPLTTSVPRDQAAIAFLQAYADLMGAGEHADLARELVLIADLDDRWVPGVHHLRFAQRIPGSDVRVFGADTFVHLDANGAVRFVAVGFVHDLRRIGAQPATTADDARRAAEATVRARDPQATVLAPKAPELIVHRRADGAGTLAWRVALHAVVDGAVEAPTVVVDASTGDVVEAEDGMAHADRTIEASNVYAYHPDCGQKVRTPTSAITYDDTFATPLAPIFKNRLARAGNDRQSAIFTDGFIGEDAAGLYSYPMLSDDPARFDFIGGRQGDGAGVSAHASLAIVDAFFRSLGQKGWDTTDWGSAPAAAIPLTAVVHAWWLPSKDPNKPLEPQIRADLTAYSPSLDVIFLGDGLDADGSPLGSPACTDLPKGVALDIVGHEFTHGIASHIAHFEVKGEAGALNEAIGDVLGSAIEHSVRDDADNFILGEDAQLAKHGARNMQTPRARPSNRAKTQPGEVPRAYSERLPMTPLTAANDYGHTHDNSLIGSHAFYLMAIGGTNDVTKLTILPRDAIGWDVGAKLWHLSLLAADRRFGQSFHDFARIQTNLAMVLSMPSPQPFPAGTTAAVACAWRAVEVFDDADLTLYGVTCSKELPPLPPPGSTSGPQSAPSPCAGHGDRPVCDDAAPQSAFACQGGIDVGTMLCADSAQRCKRTSASDATAHVDDDGGLICE